MRTIKYLILCLIMALFISQTNVFAQCTEAKDTEMAKYMKLTKTQDAQGCSQCGMLALYFCSAKYCVKEEDVKKVGAMIAGVKENIRQMGEPYCCPDYLNKEPQWGIMAGNATNGKTSNTPGKASPDNSAENTEDALNTIAKQLETNPDNPLNIDGQFLSDFSQLLPEGALKSTLESYSANLGLDQGLSSRQVYWDVSSGFDQYPHLNSNSKYAATSQQLNLMFENYSLLADKLQNSGGNYELGYFMNDPAIISGLANITGSYESAQALGMGVELATIFTQAFSEDKKFKEDYTKLASLSTKNVYAETDINLSSALIDANVGIEDNQLITQMYRYDFSNGASLRVENSILKYFNTQKGIVKNLMVVDRRHDGNLYKSKELRGYKFSTVAISPDEKVFYLFVNPMAISDVSCEDCLEKSGYTINTDDGEIIFTKLGTPYDWQVSPSGGAIIDFNESNIPAQYGFMASLGFFHISGSPFVADQMIAHTKTKYSLLDRNKKFNINGRQKKFKDSDAFLISIFRGAKSQFFYLFEKDSSYVSLIWANSLNEGLLAGDGTSYAGSMIQISKSKDFKTLDYYNTDGMVNELTGLAMTRAGDLYFAGKDGNLGVLYANDYKLDDPLLASQMRKAMGKTVFASYNFIANKSYISSHGDLVSPAERFPYYPSMKLTPDDKIVVYTINDKLYIIKADDPSNVKHFNLSCQPYNYFFTKENGDWVVNLQALNEFKFPITKKYSINKLISAFDSNKLHVSKRGNSAKAPSSNFSLADEIKKLKDLLDSGALTVDEYEVAKKQLLNR